MSTTAATAVNRISCNYGGHTSCHCPTPPSPSASRLPPPAASCRDDDGVGANTHSLSDVYQRSPGLLNQSLAVAIQTEEKLKVTGPDGDSAYFTAVPLGIQDSNQGTAMGRSSPACSGGKRVVWVACTSSWEKKDTKDNTVFDDEVVNGLNPTSAELVAGKKGKLIGENRVPDIENGMIFAPGHCREGIEKSRFNLTLTHLEKASNGDLLSLLGGG